MSSPVAGFPAVALWRIRLAVDHKNLGAVHEKCVHVGVFRFDRRLIGCLREEDFNAKDAENRQVR